MLFHTDNIVGAELVSLSDIEITENRNVKPDLHLIVETFCTSFGTAEDLAKRL